MCVLYQRPSTLAGGCGLDRKDSPMLVIRNQETGNIEVRSSQTLCDISGFGLGSLLSRCFSSSEDSCGADSEATITGHEQWRWRKWEE
jgi:hypothetical protein